MAWSYTENFDSYNIATLVGQGGWTEYSGGQPDWMVVNSPAGAQGGKAAEWRNVLEGTEYKTSLGLTDSSGKLYLVHRWDSSIPDGKGCNLRFGGITPTARFFAYSGASYGYGFWNSTAEYVTVRPTNGVWYVVELDLGSTQSRCRYRPYTTSSWSAYSAYKTNEGTLNANSIYMNADSGSSLYGFQIDLISTTEPAIPSSPTLFTPRLSLLGIQW